MLKVEPIPNQKLNYWVPSISKNGENHIVDLSINDKVWDCDCPGYDMVIKERIKEGEPLFIGDEPNGRACCCHIAAAYRNLSETISGAYDYAIGPDITKKTLIIISEGIDNYEKKKNKSNWARYGKFMC